MKPTRNIFRLIFMALLLATAAALPSCSESDGVGVSGDNIVNLSVCFKFTVSDATPDASSRASGGYEPGQGFENYVDVAGGDIRVYLFDTDNNYLGTLSDMIVMPYGEPGDACSYYVDGKISAEMDRLRNFKVCVLANWKNYPEPGEGDNLSKLWQENPETIYDFDNSPLSASNAIPFYGIKEFSNVAFVENGNIFLGEVSLLRAYAKIEVNLDSTVPSLRSVTITRVNRKGYKAPKDVDSESKYIHNSYENDWVNNPNIVTGCGTDEIHMDCVQGSPSDHGIRKFVAYVPEYDNTGKTAVETRIRLDFEKQRPGNSIYFKYYETTGAHDKDERFDLLRNYIYRYNVTLNLEAQIELKYVVCPWGKRDPVNIEFD